VACLHSDAHCVRGIHTNARTQLHHNKNARIIRACSNKHRILESNIFLNQLTISASTTHMCAKLIFPYDFFISMAHAAIKIEYQNHTHSWINWHLALQRNKCVPNSFFHRLFHFNGACSNKHRKLESHTFMNQLTFSASTTRCVPYWFFHTIISSENPVL